jgi:hypothetical protein
MLTRPVIRLILLALLLPGVAHADWQNTKWGMSRAQAQKITNGRTPDPAQASGWTMGGLPPALVFDYRSGDLTFIGALYFGDGKGGLSIVVLRLANPTADWSKLLAALRQRYGAPSSDEPMSYSSRLTKWFTQREEIQYYHQLITSPTGSASVTYISRKQGNAKGL